MTLKEKKEIEKIYKKIFAEYEKVCKIEHKNGVNPAEIMAIMLRIRDVIAQIIREYPNKKAEKIALEITKKSQQFIEKSSGKAILEIEKNAKLLNKLADKLDKKKN